MAASAISLNKLEPPRTEKGPELLIAGLGERYTSETSGRIPAQWERFARYLGRIPGQVGSAAYGVLCKLDEDGNLEHDVKYITGVEVSDIAKIPAGWSHVRIPAREYAVFSHRENISTIRRTWSTIHRWLPKSGMKVADAPQFERYGESFNGATGDGGVEIWIPIVA